MYNDYAFDILRRHGTRAQFAYSGEMDYITDDLTMDSMKKNISFPLGRKVVYNVRRSEVNKLKNEGKPAYLKKILITFVPVTAPNGQVAL